MGVDCGRSFGWGDLLFPVVVYTIVGLCYRVFCMYLYIWRCKIGVMQF
jgi:hypothetical protein